MDVIIAKFGQFDLPKAHYLTSADFKILQIRLRTIARLFFYYVKVCKFVGLASCELVMHNQSPMI